MYISFVQHIQGDAPSTRVSRGKERIEYSRSTTKYNFSAFHHVKKQAAQSWKDSIIWKLSVRKDTEASAVNVRFSVANPKSRSRGQSLQVLRKCFLLHRKRLF